MVNDCNVSIILKGEDVSSFRATLRTLNPYNEIVPFSFHQTVPVKKGENSCEKWDTQYDAYGVNIVEESDEKIVITCYTAWGPPYEWGLNLANIFPNLTIVIAHYEYGFGEYGYMTIKDDNIKKNKFTIEEEDIKNGDDDNEDEPIGVLKAFIDRYF